MRARIALGFLIAALALAVAGASAASGPTAAKTKTRTVKVGDDYYSPAKLTVKKGTKVKWSWLMDNTDTHDVRLKKGPHGVKKFKSSIAASDFTYSKKLTVPGTYRIYCSLHKDMKETIIVKR